MMADDIKRTTMYSDADIMATLQKYKEHAEAQGLIVYAIALKGSQNYNLADEESDIDANLVYIPTPRQLRAGTTYKYEFDEGEVVCHNIYDFAAIVAKGNPQWVEVCNTEYVIGDLSLFKHYKLNPSALKGMMMEKVHSFSKLYPSRAKFVKQFGYDPKQLHHIIRLYDCLNHDTPIFTYNDYDRDYMLSIKRGQSPGSVEKAEAVKEAYVKQLEALYETKKKAYIPQEVDYDLLDSILIKYYKEHL